MSEDVVYDEEEGRVVVINVPPTPETVVSPQPTPSVSVLSRQGPRGPEGLTAYEVAVENGFSGTEAQWLASLEADAVAIVAEHVVDTTPHPAYDDLPSLTLLFENGLI